MNKIAFKMTLKEGAVAEYKKRHQEIWPELTTLLNESGIMDYSIFLDPEDNKTLFAVHAISDRYDFMSLQDHPIMKRWWGYMADLMEVNPDNSPKSFGLESMFYLP